jgi:hypothetical protein
MMFVYVKRPDNQNLGKWINTDFIEQIGHIYAKESKCGETQLGMCVHGESFFIEEEVYDQIIKGMGLKAPCDPSPPVGEPLREIVGNALENTKGRNA